MTRHITVERFNVLLAETTPLAAHSGISAERIEDGQVWPMTTNITINFLSARQRAICMLIARS